MSEITDPEHCEKIGFYYKRGTMYRLGGVEWLPLSDAAR